MKAFIDIRVDEPLVPEMIAKLGRIGISCVYYTREDGYSLIKVNNEELQEAVKRERQKEDDEVRTKEIKQENIKSGQEEE